MVEGEHQQEARAGARSHADEREPRSATRMEKDHRPREARLRTREERPSTRHSSGTQISIGKRQERDRQQQDASETRASDPVQERRASA